MKKDERIQLVEEAAQKINEAINLLEEAVQGTPEESMTTAYTIGHLRTQIGQGNPYDHHTDKIIQGLEEWDEMEEGDAHCQHCDRVKPQEEFVDEDTCTTCYEKHLEEG